MVDRIGIVIVRKTNLPSYNHFALDYKTFSYFKIKYYKTLQIISGSIVRFTFFFFLLFFKFYFMFLFRTGNYVERAQPIFR